MKKKILDRKFTHHAWFTGSNLTRRQAIEYFASCVGDFSLKKRNKVSDILFSDDGFDYVLRGSEDGRSWTMTVEEAAYYMERLSFWKEYWKSHSFSDRTLVPEYMNYVTALNA